MEKRKDIYLNTIYNLERAMQSEMKELFAELKNLATHNAELGDALGDLHSLYSETDRTLEPEEVLGRVQELLYGQRQPADMTSDIPNG